MSFEQAKNISKKLQNSKHISALIYFRITSVKEQKLSYKHNKALQTHITKIEYTTKKGDIISTLEL